MKKQKSKQPSRAPSGTEKLPARNQWIAQPKARRLLGDVDPVTWWRWRQKPGFPTEKVINRRVYFLWGEVSDWWNAQPEGKRRAS